jgi:hypothetical protein
LLRPLFLAEKYATPSMRNVPSLAEAATAATPISERSTDAAMSSIGGNEGDGPLWHMPLRPPDKWQRAAGRWGFDLVLPPFGPFHTLIGKRSGTGEFMDLSGFPLIRNGRHHDQLFCFRGLMVRWRAGNPPLVRPPTDITHATVRGWDQLSRFTKKPTPPKRVNIW